jgi:hypothetical protein
MAGLLGTRSPETQQPPCHGVPRPGGGPAASARRTVYAVTARNTAAIMDARAAEAALSDSVTPSRPRSDYPLAVACTGSPWSTTARRRSDYEPNVEP